MRSNAAASGHGLSRAATAVRGVRDAPRRPIRRGPGTCGPRSTCAALGPVRSRLQHPSGRVTTLPRRRRFGQSSLVQAGAGAGVLGGRPARREPRERRFRDERLLLVGCTALAAFALFYNVVTSPDIFGDELTYTIAARNVPRPGTLPGAISRY